MSSSFIKGVLTKKIVFGKQINMVYKVKRYITLILYTMILLLIKINLFEIFYSFPLRLQLARYLVAILFSVMFRVRQATHKTLQ